MISIIMPVYNSGLHLRDMLDSILSQTFKDWEMVLVDDSSTDNSLDICKEYANKDERIRVIQQKNSGPGVARNTGINNSKGDYIYFADSDDWMDKQMLETLYNVITKYQADIIVSNYWEEYEDATRLINKVDKGINIYDSTESMKLIMSNRIASCLWSMLFKRTLITEPFPNKYLYEDYIALGKWSFHIHKMVTIDKAFYHYRQHKNSLIHKRDEVKSKITYLNAFMERWKYAQSTVYFNKEFDFFIKEYVNFLINNARDTARTSVSFEEIKLILEKNAELLSQQKDISRASVSIKTRFREYLLLHHKAVFTKLMKLTAHVSKGYQKNLRRDTVQNS